MKKFLRSLLAITLLLGIVSTTALAAEPRWRNVASISLVCRRMMELYKCYYCFGGYNKNRMYAYTI